MSAHLYPGIRSLHLVLDTPYDLIRTDDIRDDWRSVKIWYSNTAGFTLASAQTLTSSTLSTTIPNLEVASTYYLRYAFISALDPDTYTVSAEMSAIVLDESSTVYGYLTNDPTGIATSADGSGGDFSLATGVFKVYNFGEDVTGTGPVYAVKPGTINFITGAAINATTGVYSCTGLTEDSGSVVFTATYNGIVVEQVWNVYKGIAGASAPILKLSTNNADFIYKDQYATVSQTPFVELIATLTNLTGIPVFEATAYTREGVLLGPIQFTQTGNTVNITSAQFGQYGNTTGTVAVTASIGTVFDTEVLRRINDGTEQITVELTNPAHPIPSANNGDTVPANYIGSGTTIKVKQGNTYLQVDPATPYDLLGSWNIFDITSVGITCDPTPTIGSNYIAFDTHAAMTADQAYIDYTIAYRTTTGYEGTQTVRQSFAKTKEGVTGASAPAVNLVAPRIAFVTPKNGEAQWPDSITLTANTSNITNPIYVWYIDDVLQNGQTNSSLTVPKFSDVGSKTIKVIVSGTSNVDEPVSVYDYLTLYQVSEGSDAIAVAIDNDNQTISCDDTGTPIAGQFPITRNTIVVRGVETLTTGVTYAKVSETGMTSSISASGVITITSITQLFAEAVYSFTVGSTVITKTVRLNKSINGASAPAVVLTASSQVFITLKNGGGYNVSSVTVSASSINIISPSYAWYVNNVLQSGQTNSTFTVSAFAAGTSKQIKCVISGGGKTAYDTLTIFSLQEGSDSLQAGLTNENQTLTADENGNIYGGQLPLTSQMVVVRGAEVLSSGVTYSKVSESGLTASISASGAISVTAFSATQIGSATFRATIGTTTLDKVLTVSKTKDGATGQSIKGDAGLQGLISKIVYAIVTQSSSGITPPNTPSGNNPTSPWQTTAPTVTVGQIVFYSYGRYNPNDTTVDGVAAYTTSWSTPIAASVFQDIKSDNWNGGTPSSGNFNGATAGYYLRRDEGALYGSAIYLRSNSNVDIDGKMIVRGNNVGSQQVPLFTINNASWAAITANLAYINEAMTYTASPGTVMRVGVVGHSNNTGITTGQINAGVLGIGKSPDNNAIGVVGVGKLGGGWFETQGINGGSYAIWAIANSTYSRAAYLAGTVDITGATNITGSLSVIGDITSTGNITAYNSSDKRFKTNIIRIDNALEKLRSLGGYTYDWTPDFLAKLGDHDPELIKHHDVGVIAQEVLAQLPQAVATRKDGSLAVNYEKLIPLLIEAILELDRKVT